MAARGPNVHWGQGFYSVEFTRVLGKFQKFNRWLSGWFEWVGILGLLVMMLVTCLDVIGAKLFLWPVPGANDIAGLSQALIAFAAGITLIIGRHIQVEFLIDKLPRRAQAVIDSIITLLGVTLFILIIWRMYALGQYYQAAGEGSGSIRIPLSFFAYGFALASIPVCLVLFQQFLNSVVGVVKG
jgi:TRAP-type C4-dicarboxylate transport system permease small subunit